MDDLPQTPTDGTSEPDRAERLKTVAQAGHLLWTIARLGPGTTTHLAARAELNRTVTHRLLATLLDGGLVRREQRNWHLGLAVLELATHVAADVRRAGRPFLDELAARSGETAILSLRDGDEAVAVAQSVGEMHPLRVAYRPGTRHPLTQGAHGQVMLAFLTPESLRHIEDAGIDLADYAATLDRIRTRGFAYTHDELESGASGYAVPVFDRGGTVIASVGVVAPASRLRAVEELVPHLHHAAAGISRRLAA